MKVRCRPDSGGAGGGSWDSAGSGSTDEAFLPTFAAAFDVALMPWLMNEWIESSNPIKLREYLAIGFPIVSTWFPEQTTCELADG